MITELKMARLFVDNNLIGYRVKIGSDFYDVDIDTLGIKIPVDLMKNKIHLIEKNGVYTSKRELKTGEIIPDMADRPDLVSEVKSYIMQNCLA